ncbi:hypothetical protein D9M70_432540 [compost metagenome]
MARDHVPEAAGIRISRHAFEHHLRGAGGQRSVGDVGVAGDPADVGGTPEQVVWLDVEGPLHRHQRPQQIAAGAVLHALGLAGGTGGVEHEQRVLGADRFGFAGVGLVGADVVEPAVAALGPADIAAGAAVDDHVFDGLAAAQRQRIVGDGLQRQRLAAAHLLVGGDQRHRAHVDQPLLQRLGGEAAEHHRVRRPQARAGLHRGHALDRHRHVDHDPVALPDAERLQAVGQAAHLGVQFTVGDTRHGAVVGLEHDRDLVGVAVFKVAVQAVVGGIELAVLEPLVERRIALVQHLGEGLVPVQQLTCVARPEAFVVAFGFLAQRAVGVHAGNRGLAGERLGRVEHAVLLHHRFDGGHRLVS